MMKKYFSSGFFLNFKSKLSAFQRTQPELLGVSEQETAHEAQGPQTNGFYQTQQPPFSIIPTSIWIDFSVSPPCRVLGTLGKHQISLGNCTNNPHR